MLTLVKSFGAVLPAIGVAGAVINLRLQFEQ